MSYLREGQWFVLPQIASRANSVVIFALLAGSLNSELLGQFAVSSAIVGLAPAVAPALVGKPLANHRVAPDLPRLAASSSSGAILLGFAVALGMTLVSLVMNDGSALILRVAALGVVAAMTLEASFWRCAFVHSARRAGTLLAVANVIQVIGVIVTVNLAHGAALIFWSYVALGVAALVLYPFWGRFSFSAGREWLTRRRRDWLYYLLASATGLVIALAIPVLLVTLVDYEAAAVYRASELCFGAVNLTIGVLTQLLLTRARSSRTEAQHTFVITSTAVVALSCANGLLIVLLPTSWLELVVGSAAPLLISTIALFTAQRAFLAASSLASTLLVTFLPYRQYASVSVSASSIVLVLTVVGAVAFALPGAIAGLALAELITAVWFSALLFSRRTRAH